MKKYILSLLLCSMALSMFADSDVLIIYRNDGKIHSFETNRIDSIVYSCRDALGAMYENPVTQEIWSDGECAVIPLERIDSIRYAVASPEIAQQAQEDYTSAIELLNDDEPDYETATSMLAEAAAENCDSAQVALAIFKEYGIGADSDMDMAIEYYNLAAEQGCQEAISKLDYLAESTSSLEMPEDCTLKEDEVFIIDGNDLNLVNGDASFRSTHSNVLAVNSDYDLIYMSFRTLVADTLDTPLVLNAKETAVSLMLSQIPCALQVENDTVFGYFKEWLSGMEETERLASAIERGVAKRGCLDTEDFAAEALAVAERIQRELGLSVLLNTPDEMDGSHAAALRKGNGKEPSANDNGQLLDGSVEISNPYCQGNKAVVTGHSYNPVTKSFKCNITYYNSLPVYFALAPGKKVDGGYRPLDDVDGMRYVVKPENLSKLYKMAGVHGINDCIETQRAFWSDLWKVITDSNFKLSDSTWDCSTGTITMDVASPEDCLIVFSTDTDFEISRDIMVYTLFDVAVWPIIKIIIKDSCSDNKKWYEFILNEFSKIIDVPTTNKIRIAIKERDWSYLWDTLQDKAYKILDKAMQSIIEDRIPGINLNTGDKHALLDNIQKALKSKGEWPYEKLNTLSDQLDAALAEIKLAKEALKMVEIACNTFSCCLYQTTTYSYGMDFNVTPAHFEPVDMGTSVRWSDRNVGSTDFGDPGTYYAWGAVEPTKKYNWSKYVHSEGLLTVKMTKYCEKDNKYELEPIDDVVHQDWPNFWRMPTKEEWYELSKSCEWQKGSLQGKPGYWAVSRFNGNKIFFPCAGYYDDDELQKASVGYYWTSSLDNTSRTYPEKAQAALLDEDNLIYINSLFRYQGLLVRPVKMDDQAEANKSNYEVDFKDTDINSEKVIVFKIRNTGYLPLTIEIPELPMPFYTEPKTYTIAPDKVQEIDISLYPVKTGQFTTTVNCLSNACNGPISLTLKANITGDDTSAQSVDLGLPSGIRWAKCNIGAKNPGDKGDYFAWGIAKPGSTFNWATYRWCKGSEKTLTKYCTEKTYGYNGYFDMLSTLADDDDPAANWGEEWRMPSAEDWTELVKYCTLTWSSHGMLVKSKQNNNFIFLPAAGYYDGSELKLDDECGYYWSSTLVDKSPMNAWCTSFNQRSFHTDSEFYRYGGQSVRPICGGTTVLVSSIAFEQDVYHLILGGTELLNTILSPSNASKRALTWTSSDPSVATVSNGVVTAIAEGTTTITATATDGGGAKASTIVKVSASGVTFEPEELIFGVVPIGETKTMPFDIYNSFNVDIQFEECKLDAPFSTDWTGGIIPAKSKKTVNITYKPTDNSQTGTQPMWFWKDAKGNEGNIRPRFVGKGYGSILTIEETELTFDCRATQKLLKLTCNDSWKASVTKGSEWLSVTPLTGNGDATIHVDAKENTSQDSRTGTVSITSGNSAPITITVVQEGVTDIEEVYATTTYDDTEYSIVWTHSTKDYRINPDGTKFYKTRFTIFKGDDGQQIPEEFYICPTGDDRIWASMCMAVDVKNDVVFFYVFGKDADQKDYSMDGYVYEWANGKLQRYALFTGKNWGWMAYFVCPSGSPVIKAFTYAGYYRLQADRTSSGWKMTQGSRISPDDFRSERMQNDHFLFFNIVPKYHSYVDLGLPSGLLWAECNIGATAPENPGDYFAWGEVKTKDSYYWSSYKWCNGTNTTLNKYCNSSSYGTVDNKLKLTASDDAATVNWGGNWRMPTSEELCELYDNCTLSYTTRGGCDGFLATSNVPGYTDKSIFLPVGGYAGGTEIKNAWVGFYWLSTLNVTQPQYADCISFSESGFMRENCNYRYGGFNIRPVCDAPATAFKSDVKTLDFGGVAIGQSKVLSVVLSSATNGPVTVTLTQNGSNCFKTDFKEATIANNEARFVNVTFTPTSSTPQTGKLVFHNVNAAEGERDVTVVLTGVGEMVANTIDMGLPSGTLWASWNIGASSPEEYGELFAWGELTSKTTYTWDNYRFGTRYDMTKYVNDSNYGAVDNKTVLEVADDAATQRWGSHWRMPTATQLLELMYNTTRTWTTVGGKVVCKLTSNRNGQVMYLPAAGIIASAKLQYRDESLYLASTDVYEERCTDREVILLEKDATDFYYQYIFRHYGISIRPVYVGGSSNSTQNITGSFGQDDGRIGLLPECADELVSE